MKIALFHNLLAGGAKRALHEYARELAGRGHTLDLYTLETADEGFLPLAPFCRRVHVEPVSLPGLVQTRLLPFAIQYLNLKRRLAVLDALKAAHGRVADAIDREGYDVAFIHHDAWTKAPHLLSQLATRSVYYCQEPLRQYYEHPMIVPEPPADLKGKLRALWYGPIEPIYADRHKGDDALNARAADLVLANSAYSRESILRAYGIEAKVAPLGVDTTLFRSTDVPKAHAVVTVGRFQENKAQAFVIEAVAQLPEAERPAVILVGESTGTTAYRDHLLALGAAKGVSVELLEHVSDEVLVDAYNRAKVCVYTPVMEPFGFVPIEAAACGVPTVGIREGGVRETVRHGETGLLVDRDVDAAARAIATLLGDAEARARMGAAALDDARRQWSWSHAAEVLEGHLARPTALLPSPRPR